MIGQRGIAHRAAQQVQVAGGVRGGGVREDRARRGRTAGRDIGRAGEELRFLGGAGRGAGEGGEVLLLFLDRGETAGPGAAGDRTWVPGHQVEAGPQFVGEQPGPVRALAQPVDARRAGSAEVHEQGADAAGGVRGGQFDDRQVDLLAVRVVVVQGDLGPGAGEPVRAVRPGQFRRGGGLGELVDVRIGRVRGGGDGERADSEENSENAGPAPASSTARDARIHLPSLLRIGRTR